LIGFNKLTRENTSSHPQLKKPIFLALDVDDPDEALRLANLCKDHVGGFKIGPRLAYQMGAEWCRGISELAPLFIDNKYFDIPSTMLSAVRVSFNSGASFVTVHALAGKVALTELAKLEAELASIRPFRILAISVLTSWTRESYPPIVNSAEVIDHVRSLTQLALDSGLSGIVCSAYEVQALSKEFPTAYFVTPGIRLPGESSDDQSRIMSPSEALKNGSSALVMGRSLLRSKDPVSILGAIYRASLTVP
jgi:orotidine-5'-phosphate decarboxylase